MISKDTIALVRDRTDIVAVVSESVPSLKKRGRRFLGLCPFHQEKTPSFNVNQDAGVYHCFGCKESGDAITFLMRVEGYDFHEAVRALAERAGIPIEEERAAAPTEADRHKKEREALYGAMNVAAAWYEEQLRTSTHRQVALDELGRRGLDAGAEAVAAFRVGYAPPTWDGLTSYLKKQGISPTLAETVGLIVPRSSGSGYYDRFRHRLMFAVIDARGRVVAFSGRALGPVPNDVAPDAEPPKYINSPESPIYIKGANLFGLWQARHAIRQEEAALLVEGNFDVVSLHARGIKTAIAPLGTAFTTEQARLLRRYAIDLTLLFDGDAAGRKAVLLAEHPCDEAGLDVKVAILPDKTDPDELVRSKGPNALRHILGQARGLFEYLIDAELDESFSAADLREKAGRVERVGGLIARQKDPVVRGMAEAYADVAAGRLDIVRSAPGAFGGLKRKILSQAKAVAATTATATRRQADGAVAGPDPMGTTKPPIIGEGAVRSFGRAAPASHIKHRPPGSEERKAITEAILDFPALLQESEVIAVLPLLEATSAQIVAAVANCMRTNVRGEKVLDTTEFLAQMRGQANAFAAARLAAPLHETIEEARETIVKAKKRLLGAHVAQETSEIVREQHRDAGNWDSEIERAKHADALVRQRLLGR
jgi:DNA primase